jgi:O-antigen/teichoic acid export membrane protein
MHGMLRLIFKNTSAQVIGRVVSSLSMLILTMVLARMFGSSGYGEFVQMTTYVSFFYLLADFGFNAIYIQLQQSEKRQIWQVLLVTRLVVGAFLCLVAFVLLSLIPSTQTTGYSNLVRIGILFLIPTIFFQSMITTANGLFQKLLRYEWSMVSVTIGALCTVASLALLLSSGSTSLLLYSVIPLCIGSAATAASSFFCKKSMLHLITSLIKTYSQLFLTLD